jgi:nucleotide-binding universal stress UspA family protein
MISRVLVAVDDSPAALAAVRIAVRIAADQHAALRAVHVVADGEVTEVLRPAARARVADRRADAGDALLAHVARLAEHGGVVVDPVLMLGEPARCVLEVARSWPADVVVLGRSGTHRTGEPYIGPETQRVLEFAEWPVLVVPAPHHR